jgi:hypothetical protein
MITAPQGILYLMLRERRPRSKRLAAIPIVQLPRFQLCLPLALEVAGVRVTAASAPEDQGDQGWPRLAKKT